jgi:carbamoyltransferase
MSPLLIGLHGSLEESPARGVHDAAYCLADTDQGQVLALVESEKISGVRHDGRLNAALLQADLALYTGTPAEIVSSHFTTFGDGAPQEFPLFRDLETLDRSDLGFTARLTRPMFGTAYPHYVYLHELAHVFSAYMYRATDHNRFLGLVVEGSGSFAQNSLFLVDDFRVALLGYNFPILSGNFFHQWLSRLIFDARREDYPIRSATPGKVMALAAYGDPERFRPALHAAVRRHRPGQYMDYRNQFCPQIETMTLSWNDRVDLCASGQALFEDLILDLAVQMREQYGPLPLYYAGGCALSIKTNTRLRRVFDQLIIPPNCADDGIALGLVALHAFLEHRTRLQPLDYRTGLFTKAHKDLCINGRLSDPDVERVARWLAAGEVVAFVQSAPEIGPRALGCRSILAAPTHPGMRDILNHIKGREYFRPVAPIVLDSVGAEMFQDYFFSPFMLYDFRVLPSAARHIPAALHVDGTSRLETIPDDESDIAQLLRAFARHTGRPPILLNTSLNSRGEPIAATREQVLAELPRLKIKHVVFGGQPVVLS